MEGGVPSSSFSNEQDDELFGLELPPGFRFHPTDEEIIMHYLLKKVMDPRFNTGAIGEADFNKCEPWDLPKKAKMGEKEWFLFCQRDKKYPTGMRTNRATESGYWKATGKDKEIYNKGNKINSSLIVGMKKTLVFYKGRAPKGEKTNWVMHEYRLEGKFPNLNFSRAAKEEWVVCKVFYKFTAVNKNPGVEELIRSQIDHSFVDHLLESPTLPPLADYSNCPNERPSSSFATDHDEPQIKGDVFFNDHKLQVQHDHIQKSFFVPHQNYTLLNTIYQPNFPQFAPNPAANFPYQTSFPFKGVDQMNLRHLTPNIGILREPDERMCKVENFSSNNSVVSHSQDTGVSTEINNEITSFKGDTESKINYNVFDQELEGLDFGPNMSDLDSFWSY